MESSAESKSGRVVVVTGAARGIGLACARRFAGAGDIVILADRDIETCQARADELGAPHFAIAMDVGNEASVVAAMRCIESQTGPLDVLVNNAGIVDAKARPILDVPSADIDALVRINLQGSYVVAREAGRQMIAANGGAIINISSGAGTRAIPGRAAYSMTKAAILGMTRALSCEWAPRGIRVNAILPGYINTEILASLERAGRFDPAAVGHAIPLGRLGNVEEVADVVFHMAGATYVSGASVSVDGGVDAFGGPADASKAPAPVMPKILRGVACVTGGANGIGAAIADKLVGDGHKVVVLDSDTDALSRIGDDRVAIELDITNEVNVERCIARISEEYGPITVLVNNAGIIDPMASTIDQNLSDFQRVIDVNLIATLQVARATARQMMANGGGAIVNLSSIVATGGMSRRNAYCASKAGVSMLTRSLACEWAEYGIRVNAVAPGFVMTSAIKALVDSGTRNLDAIKRRIPMGRLGTPEEIADVVCFLSSSAASYMTGAVYTADGGYGAYGDVGSAFTES